MLKYALLLIVLVLGSCAQPPDDDDFEWDPPVGAVLNEAVVRIPTEVPPVVTMEVTLMHPDGAGPFPLAVVNHGADGINDDHRGHRYHRTNAAFYFLSRGYAVAMPMMRGFSTTGGELYHFGCDITATGLANARDIASVIRYLGNDPRFDTRRVIVAGQSLGGWNTLAVGALGLPNVVGLVNFNGGMKESDCATGDASLQSGAANFGARTKIPSIWFYGDNDEIFPRTIWRSMVDDYTGAGGRAEIVDVGTTMGDSHFFLAYPEVLPIWTTVLDRFLAQVDMPHTDIHPNDLPTQFPSSTQFAAVGNVDAVPYLSDNGRDLYRNFLTLSPPRVFAIAPNGFATSMDGGLDPIGRALAACRDAGTVCRIYAVDDRVVWTLPGVRAEAKTTNRRLGPP
jgi:dienelactone hydrolase